MRRLFLVAGVLLGVSGNAGAQQLPPPPTGGQAVGVTLKLTVEQTKLIVDVFGQAQCGALSVSTLALCQRMTELLEEIRRQAREQIKPGG